MDGIVGGLKALEAERHKAITEHPALTLQTPAENGVADVAWCGDNRTLISSAASDSSVLVWDTDRRRVTYALERSGRGRAVACSADARLVASAVSDKDSQIGIRIWDLATPDTFRDIASPFLTDSPPGFAKAIFFRRGLLYAHWVRGSTPEQHLIIYRGPDWAPVGRFRLQGQHLSTSSALSDSGLRYAYAHHDKSVKISVVDLNTGVEVFGLTAGKFRIAALSFANNDQSLLIGGHNLSDTLTALHAVHEYDLRDRKLLRSIATRHLWELQAVASRVDPDILITTSLDRTAEVRRASTGALLSTLGDTANPIYATALRPDGKALVTAGNRAINVWAMGY